LKYFLSLFNIWTLGIEETSEQLFGELALYNVGKSRGSQWQNKFQTTHIS